MSAASDFAKLHRLTPAEAVAYLQGRGALTQTYDWRDLWHDEHAQQFTVSRLARLDLLKAVQDGITASVKGDLSRRDWTRDLTALLQKEGWWGKKDVTDPATGETKTTTFDPARLKLIYDVNTRQAHSAGRWERFERNQATHPYIRYITKRDERVRASHRDWDNLTLPVGHAFWAAHYPPNGWRCRCRAMSMTQAEYDAGHAPTGAELVKTAPKEEFKDWTNKRTGETMRIPVGIDPGFDYNAGKAAMRAQALEKVVVDKLASAPPALAEAAQKAGFTRSAHADAEKWVLEQGKKVGKSIEFASVVAEDGTVILRKKGGKSNVTFTAEEYSAMRGATLYHNHPSSRSLSLQDLSAVGNIGLKEIVAVGHDGSVYRASAISIKGDAMRRMHKAVEKKVSAKIIDLVKNGDVLDADAFRWRHHIVNSILGKSGAAAYSISDESVVPAWAKAIIASIK